MKISIVISTYNGEKYIVDQMESLRLQRRAADEVLFFDDCSSDNTVQIIKDYIDKYQLTTWKLTENTQNKGWKKNFIEGMWKATGDLIFPCDQDDIWMLNKLSELENIMKNHPEIELLTTNVEAFYDNGSIIIKPEKEDNQIIKQSLSSAVFDIRYPGCTYCARKCLIDRSKLYWEDDFPHDALLWRMAMFSETLYSYNKSLIKWRRHNDSSYTLESIKSKTFSSKRKWLIYAQRVIKSLIKYVENEKCANSDNKISILNKNMQWLICRASFYDTKNVFTGIKLLKYRKNYMKFKQYLGDWYLIYFQK